MNTVIVNGLLTSLSSRTCERCVQDTTVPGIRFDARGVCNYCRLHEEMEAEYPNDERGAKILQKNFERIRNQSRGAHDCIIGISGGRDSTFLLWLAKKRWNLRPLAVHFNDGFDNPVAGENMVRACRKLEVPLITITSDWREAKELKVDFLKASTPDLNLGTDIGIAASMYGVAAKLGVKNIFIGQSFRTEGVKPLPWSYFDGDYLRKVHGIFGNVRLREWSPTSPGFHFGIKELSYYSFLKGIRVLTPLYYYPYVRKEVDEIIRTELEWVYPGAHYFDDLYHSLIKYVHRVKFGIDLNMNSDSALVRSGQMSRELALSRAHGIYQIENEDIIRLCLKRLGLSRAQFEDYLAIPPKTFLDYPTSYSLFKKGKFAIRLLARGGFLPRVVYRKYFEFTHEAPI